MTNKHVSNKGYLEYQVCQKGEKCVFESIMCTKYITVLYSVNGTVPVHWF